VLVNSAGIQRPGAVVGYDVEDWDRQFAVNARGTFSPRNTSPGGCSTATGPAGS